MRPQVKRHIGGYAFPALTIIVTGVYLWDVRDISDPDLNLLLVNPLAWGTILVSLYLAATHYISRRRERRAHPATVYHNGSEVQPSSEDEASTPPEPITSEGETSTPPDPTHRKFVWVKPAAWIGLFVLYILIVESVGFLFVTPFFLAAMMLILDVRSVVKILAVSLLTTAFFYIVFDLLLNVGLP